jgi:hypothetical protein
MAILGDSLADLCQKKQGKNKSRAAKNVTEI